MTVTAVNALYAECNGAEISGGRSYVAYYQVLTDDRDDGPVTAYTAVGIPSLNTSFAFGNDADFGSFVHRYTATLDSKDATLKKWRVAVYYQFRGEADGQDTPPVLWDFPWDKPAVISGDGLTTTEPLTANFDGTPVTNSANDYFRGEYRDRSFPTLVIVKNFQTINLSTYIDYADSLNDAAFFGLAEQSWKLSFPRWRQLYFGPNKYYEVTFEFSGRPDGWQRSMVDQGEYYWEGGLFAGSRLRFTDGQQRPLHLQNLLDGNGDQVAQFGPPVYIAADPYEPKDFSALDIPTDF